MEPEERLADLGLFTTQVALLLVARLPTLLQKPGIGGKFARYHPAAEFGIAPASTRGLLRRFKSGSEVGAGPHLDRTEVGNETGSLDRRRAGFG